MNNRTRFALMMVPIKMRLRNHTMWFLEQCLMKLDIDRYERSHDNDYIVYKGDPEFWEILFGNEEDDNDY